MRNLILLITIGLLYASCQQDNTVEEATELATVITTVETPAPVVETITHSGIDFGIDFSEYVGTYRYTSHNAGNDQWTEDSISNVTVFTNTITIGTTDVLEYLGEYWDIDSWVLDTVNVYDQEGNVMYVRFTNDVILRIGTGSFSATIYELNDNIYRAIETITFGNKSGIPTNVEAQITGQLETDAEVTDTEVVEETTEAETVAQPTANTLADNLVGLWQVLGHRNQAGENKSTGTSNYNSYWVFRPDGSGVYIYTKLADISIDEFTWSIVGDKLSINGVGISQAQDNLKVDVTLTDQDSYNNVGLNGGFLTFKERNNGGFIYNRGFNANYRAVKLYLTKLEYNPLHSVYDINLEGY